MQVQACIVKGLQKFLIAHFVDGFTTVVQTRITLQKLVVTLVRPNVHHQVNTSETFTILVVLTYTGA